MKVNWNKLYKLVLCKMKHYFSYQIRINNTQTHFVFSSTSLQGFFVKYAILCRSFFIIRWFSLFPAANHLVKYSTYSNFEEAVLSSPQSMDFNVLNACKSAWIPEITYSAYFHYRDPYVQASKEWRQERGEAHQWVGWRGAGEPNTVNSFGSYQRWFFFH